MKQRSFEKEPNAQSNCIDTMLYLAHANGFRHLAVEPEFGNSVPHWASLMGAGLEDTGGPF